MKAHALLVTLLGLALSFAAAAVAGCAAHNVVGEVEVPDGGGNGTGGGMPPGPACKPAAATETTCSGAGDDDCDGFVDCLDSDCEGKSCGNGLTCMAGA